MKVTDIKQQVKRADRYSIYIDGKYFCSLSESELLNQTLRPGVELNDGDVRSLKAVAVKDKAYDRSLNLLARRPRSEWEIYDYLRRKEYEEEVIHGTIQRLIERGYINDHEFARRWIDSRRLLKPVSRRRLTQELRQKRVAAGVIQEVLEEEVVDERDVLRELVARKKTKYPDRLKFMQFLARQGYNYEDIKSVLDEQV